MPSDRHFGIVLNFKDVLNREKLAAKLPAVADALAQRTRERIEAGGDVDAPIAPTTDGRKALTGAGFLGLINGHVTDRGVAVSADHVNARRLLKGTTGRGGTEEPIRPRRGKWLWGMFADGLRRFLKADFVPRPFLRFTKDDLRACARAFFPNSR